jgi:midasin (ATPase involved in ribosome maturation)
MPEDSEQEEILSERQNLQEKSASLIADIDSLIDQTLQIHELSSKEGEFIESIGSSISILLTTLKVSLPLSQSIFQNDFAGIKTAIINNNAEIIIMQANRSKAQPGCRSKEDRSHR